MFKLCILGASGSTMKLGLLGVIKKGPETTGCKSDSEVDSSTSSLQLQRIHFIAEAGS